MPVLHPPMDAHGCKCILLLQKTSSGKEKRSMKRRLLSKRKLFSSTYLANK